MFEYLAYLAALCLSLGGLAFVDWRWKLVFWKDPKAAFRVLLIGLCFFIFWDLYGISSGIFYEGQSPYITGLMLAPHLPVEEIFFLTLLCYTPMLVWEGLERRRVR